MFRYISIATYSFQQNTDKKIPSEIMFSDANLDIYLSDVVF